MPNHRHQKQVRENKENWIILTSIALTIVFALYDIYSDTVEGESKLHLIAEILITTTTFVGFIFIWRRTLALHRDVQLQKQVLAQAEASRDAALAESLHWRTETANVVRGLSAAIDSQLVRWSLTAAEKEVALLLLKGLSLKEIAEVRSVSEKTARAQSFAIYAKSGLAGRAELSAFFLEDLLFPIDTADQNLPL